jgi:SNF2 family DNA or RNA helicase
MLTTFTFDYNQEEGEILILSPDEGLHETVQEIYSIIFNIHTEHEIMTLKNGLSISVPVFIEHFYSILEILRHVNHGIHFTDEGISIINTARGIVETEDIIREPLSEKEINDLLEDSGWNSETRPISEFQMRNLIKTTRRDNAAIFSVPGAGKTVEALAYTNIVSGQDTLYLVVCPRNAYIAWEHEMKECLGITKDEIIRCTGNDDEIKGKLMIRNKPYKAVLVNYNRLWMRYRAFSLYIQKMIDKGHNVVCIFDESHHFKGGKMFTSGVRRIAPFATHRIILSGTPMPKEPTDLVHQFKALLPYKMGEINFDNVTDVSQGRFVRTTKNDQRLKEPVIVLDSSTTFEMDPVQKRLHDLCRNIVAAELRSGGNRKLQAEIIRLQRIMVFAIMIASNPTIISNDRFHQVVTLAEPDIAEQLIEAKKTIEDYGPKFRYACRRARDLASQGKKVLIWSSFTDNVGLLAEELQDLGAVYIRGDVPTEEGKDDPYKDFRDVSEEEEETREKRIKKFKTDDSCMVMIANPAAAGEGISLHDVCHHAIYVDRIFNATHFMQSMDRIHRYGKDKVTGEIICQKHTTTIEILCCKDSIDSMVHSNLARKMKAMYEWLNDPDLNPQLSALDPFFTDEELEMFVNQ